MPKPDNGQRFGAEYAVFNDADGVVIRLNHEPAEHAARLLASLGCIVVIDPNAAECDCPLHVNTRAASNREAHRRRRERAAAGEAGPAGERTTLGSAARLRPGPGRRDSTQHEIHDGLTCSCVHEEAA